MNLFNLLRLKDLRTIGFACMPGYGYERMKLKEYLGIEWIENGFDETGKSTFCSTELECKLEFLPKFS